jgi:GNAT superfamily N-acetyltransferase
MHWQRDGYELTDDPSRLDLGAVCALLGATYWGANRSRATMETAVRHSVCFGLYHGPRQVGFARVISDFSTFAYLGDVIVAPEHRGQGLGKWMVEKILAHPAMQTATQCLRTKDAHSLYERHGFERTEYLRRSENDWSKGEGANPPV